MPRCVGSAMLASAVTAFGRVDSSLQRKWDGSECQVFVLHCLGGRCLERWSFLERGGWTVDARSFVRSVVRSCFARVHFGRRFWSDGNVPRFVSRSRRVAGRVVQNQWSSPAASARRDDMDRVAGRGASRCRRGREGCGSILPQILRRSYAFPHDRVILCVIALTRHGRGQQKVVLGFQRACAW